MVTVIYAEYFEPERYKIDKTIKPRKYRGFSLKYF